MEELHNHHQRIGLSYCQGTTVLKSKSICNKWKEISVSDEFHMLLPYFILPDYNVLFN